MHKTDIPEDWFDPLAPMGVGIRYRHPGCCDGKDKALVITRFDRGWLWKCHRCQEKGVRFADNLSPSDYQKWQQTPKPTRNRTENQIQLPADFTHNIPSQGLAWLYKYRLTDQNILKWKIGYSPMLKRVIMPVYNKGELVYWQGRTLTTPNKRDNPKYINVMKSTRDSIYFWNLRGTDRIVLVEDILSAIRVGKICSSIGLLYAYVPDDLVFQCSSKYKDVILWLDWDKNDRVFDRVKRYRTLGLPVKSIMTKNDPKAYSDAFINEQIYGG